MLVGIVQILWIVIIVITIHNTLILWVKEPYSPFFLILNEILLFYFNSMKFYNKICSKTLYWYWLFNRFYRKIFKILKKIVFQNDSGHFMVTKDRFRQRYHFLWILKTVLFFLSQVLTITQACLKF